MVKKAVRQSGITNILLRHGEEPVRSLFKAVLTASSQFAVDPSQTLKPDHDLVLVCLHQGKGSMNGLHWAVEEVRLKPGPQATVPIILCAFESVEMIRRAGLARYGIDVPALLRIGTLRLPFLKADLHKRVTEELRVPRLAVADVEAATEAIREGNARKVLADFIHDCRNVPQTAQGWKRIARDLFPKLERDVRQWETPKVAILKAERARLAKIIKLCWKEAESPFAKLFTLFQELEGKERAVPTTPVATVPPGESLGWTTTVLVIEDDQRFADSVAESLRKAGHTVALYTDAGKKLDKLVESVVHARAANRAEVVLLDLNFGTKEKGLAILQGLRRSSQDTKIIMLTGYGGRFIEEASALKADGYLIKPDDLPALLPTIESVLAEKHVLIVDDQSETVMTRGFTMHCRTRRWRVTTRNHAEDFLRALRGGSDVLKDYDLVLLDWTFDGQPKGKDLLAVIKEARPTLPVLILSGHGDDRTRRDAFFGQTRKAGAVPDGFLVKPMDQQALERIQAILYPSVRRLALSIGNRTVKLLGAGGQELSRGQLPLKQFVFLYCLALKRKNGVAGISADSNFEDDEAAQAQRLDPEFDWEYRRFAEYRTRIHDEFDPPLDAFELIIHPKGGCYELSPEIQDVLIQ